MKVCCISDLHGILIDNIEPCDLVLICGDSIALNCQASSKKTKKWFLNNFKPWANNLPCNKVLFIAGNHDIYLNKDNSWIESDFSRSHKVTYLEDEEYVFTKEGKSIRIYGTPWCKEFGNWAFMAPDDILRNIYLSIPEGLDILMTHDAPYGCSDILLEKDCPWVTDEHIGNIPLREIILAKKPKICAHGHLHSTNHLEEKLGDTIVRNCSIVTEKYEKYYYPIYLEL